MERAAGNSQFCYLLAVAEQNVLSHSFVLCKFKVSEAHSHLKHTSAGSITGIRRGKVNIYIKNISRSYVENKIGECYIQK